MILYYYYYFIFYFYYYYFGSRDKLLHKRAVKHRSRHGGVLLIPVYNVNICIILMSNYNFTTFTAIESLKEIISVIRK